MTDKNFYSLLSQNSHFPAELIAEALKYSDILCAKRLQDIFFNQRKPEILSDGTLFFRNSLYPYGFFDTAREVITSAKIPQETGFLYLYIYFAKKSYALYKSLNFSERIFFDTMSTVFSTANQFFAENGYYGTYDYIWLCNHLRANVIRLGSFEYQNGIYSYSEKISLGKDQIKPESRAVFLHVPFAADFSHSARLSSYKQASQMFDCKVLICDSWLLYPENAKSLGENSNIADFYKDFSIFHVDTSKSTEDLYRIFGKNCDFADISTLPCKTRLQKIYIERLKKGLPSGSAVGVRKL